MRRLLPYPILWLSLVAMWLLLAGSASAGQVLLGVLVATFACWAVVPLAPPKPRLGRIWSAVELVALFIADVVRSNIAVFRIIVTGREPHSAFVRIPLELTDLTGLAILAAIVTATPGSAWIQHDSVRGIVIIHVFHVADDAAWAEALKDTYERRLMEIFQ